MPKNFVIGVMCAFIVTAGATAPANAQESAESDGWQFRITPYFFMAGLDGKVGAQGITTRLDVPFSDVFDHLDMGLMATATAQKNRWIFGVDAMYIKISSQGSKSLSGPFGYITASGTAELTTTLQIYQPTVAYRLFDDPVSTLDFYVAARYTSLENDVYLAITTDIPSFPGGTRSLSDDQSWWDPVIGARTLIPFCGKFRVMALADFGGFGGAGSDVTYQWMLTAGWQFAHHFSLDAGYRYFMEDYEEDGFVWDMVTKGPVVGIGISF